MVSASPRPSFRADLLQLGKKTDTSTPVPHPLYCFPSPPDQHSLKGLAGTAVTTDFLCLSFRLEIAKEYAGHRVCAGHKWGPLTP